jgi:hypothetical protein
LDSKSKALDF